MINKDHIWNKHTPMIIVMILLVLLMAGGALADYYLPSSEPSVISGLVAEYHLNGNASDSSGNGNTGVINGAYFTQGVNGKALRFDGVDDYVGISDAFSLDGMDQLTIENWINANNVMEGGIVTKIDVTQINGGSYWFSLWNGKLSMGIFQSLNPMSLIYITSDAEVIPLGKWTHVAGVWRGGNTIELYVNGKQIQGTSGRLGSIPTFIADNDVPVNIGRYESVSGSNVVPSGWFNGKIDEIRIYNSALNGDEIKAQYDCDVINHFPVSEFTFSPSSPAVGENVIFNASLTSGADGAMTNFSWDFGDGGIANGSKVNHSYLRTGVYTVNLTMTDNTGLRNSISKSVVVSFNIGDIPPQTAWHNQTVEFRIHSDELGQYATYNMTASPQPGGKLSINLSTGLFSYTPDLQDKEQFYVTFKAASDNESRSQVVEFVPMPHLPPEQTAFGLQPVHPVPDPEDKDYLLINSVLSNSNESFNYMMRSTRNISISGKTIVFQSGHWNGLHSSYNDNEDIKNMNIYAETVIFRSPLVLPQTNVVIYARELRFEGSAYIKTTPMTKTTPLLPFANGTKGLKAGDIELHVESFYSEPGNNTRFIMKGGTGQAGGDGQDGGPGQSMEIVESKIWPGEVVYMLDCRYYQECVDYGIKEWPGDGVDAIPGGRPGDGGDSGRLESIIDLSAYADLNGGEGGKRAINKGGVAGTPKYALWILCLRNQPCGIEADHTSSNGTDSIAPSANNGTGGSFIKINDKYSWFHPYALRMILAHAKDTYLYGHISITEKILQNYTDLLNNYSISPWWGTLPETRRNELTQIKDEMQILLHRINNNLDYFGNPPGWVPMLSFEVNKLAFEQEIDKAIRVLYLSYWINNASSTIQARVDALTYARNKNMEEIQTLKNQYNDLIINIPKLKAEGEAVALQENNLIEKSKWLEQRLLERAQNNVDERYRVPLWKKGTQILGAICSLSPIGQPVAGYIGSGLSLISKIDELKPEDIVSEIKSISKIDYAQYGRNCDDLFNEIKNIPPEFDPKLIASYLGNVSNKGEPILKEMIKYKDIFKKTEIPVDEVDAELQKIRASDPELIELTDQIAKLMTRKEVLIQELGKSMQLTSKISSDITFNLLAIDGLNRGIAEGNAVLDHRASLYLKEMEKRAKERLLKYHYYMAKSYEYRFLEPYSGEFKLDSMFDRFKTIIVSGSGHNLTQADFDALKALYEEQLSNLVYKILTQYEANHPQLSAPIRFNLTLQEITKLNAKEPLTINLVERGIFFPSDENVRIVKLLIKNMDVHLENENVGGWAYLDVNMEHSGLSKLVRGGEVYQFRHYNSLTENPLTWRVRYDGIDHNITSLEPSAASDSLLRSLITLTDDQIMLYSRPAAWADIKLSKYVNTQTGVDMLIDNLRLEVIYDFTPQSNGKVKLRVMTEGGLMPYFIINKMDINGRQDGRGNFHRTYNGDPNENITIKAPAVYGMWQFEKWTDQYGRPAGRNSSDRVLELNLSTDQTIFAHMKYISDVTPPASIGSLKNITYAPTYINWTWINPADPDINRIMLYLNGSFVTNITSPQSYYNFTGLDTDTIYELSTHTVDNSGNINATWVNATSRTQPLASVLPIAECGPDKLKCENTGAPVQFNVSSSRDGDIVSYSWEFGDGTFGTGVAPNHTYSTYGWNGSEYQTFTINLTVMDNDGMKNNTSRKVVIWMAGDANGDGKVNILDASIIGLKWGSSDPCADLNNDGRVNIIDASIIGLNWGRLP